MGPEHEQLPQQDAADATEVAPQPSADRDRILTLLMVLEPGDHAHFAQLLRSHPEFREDLIAEATSLLGSDFVGKALALLAEAAAEQAPAQAPTPEEPPPPEELADAATELKVTGVDEDGSLAIELVQSTPEPEAKAEVMTEIVEQAPAEAAQAVEQLAEPEEQSTEVKEAAPEPVPEAEVAQTPTADAKEAEPGWVTRARAYNEAHIGLVDEFNDLTGFICALGEGIIDPALVARWQASHGVPPDGRVGPQTVAAARRGAEPEPAAQPEAAPADGAPPPPT